MYAFRILADVPYPQNLGLLVDLRCPNLGDAVGWTASKRLEVAKRLWVRIWIERVGSLARISYCFVGLCWG
jgi:hypothetical protein